MRSRRKTNKFDDVVPVPTPAPVLQRKQVIMYFTDDDEPDRLFTIARLEDSTVDKIARRVVELLDERKGKKK